MLALWYLCEVGIIILIFIHKWAKAQIEPEWQEQSGILFTATHFLHFDIGNSRDCEEMSLEGVAVKPNKITTLGRQHPL